MSDTSLASFGFDVNTAGLRAGSDELARFEQRIDSAAAAVRRLEAISATAMSKASPMGGSAANVSGTTAAQQGLATAAAATTSVLAAQTTALHGVTAAHQAHGAAMGNSTLAALELAHISRSLFDEWAAGGSVMRGLLMEGGRIQLMLSSGGGLAGLFGLVTTKVGDLTTKALGLANPFTLGATAVVGFGAAALTAISHVRSLREEMDRALAGVVHFTGLSGEGLDALARRATSASALSPTSGLPLDAARGAAEAMARTGRMSPDNISGGLGLVRGYASAFGVSYDEAGSKLADIFRDPVKGADTLNERLGFLDARTRTYIQSLRDQGDAQSAITALQAAAAPSLNEQVKPPGTWERFSNWWSTRNEEVEHGIARYFGNLTPEERLAASERDAANRRLVGATSYDPNDDPMNLSENVRRASQLRAMQQRDLIFNRSSLEVDSTIGRIDPEAARYRLLQNQSKSLSDALANPDVTSRLPDGMSSSGKLVSGADLLAETLGKVNDKLSNWMSGVEKSTLAVNANVMGINAWTLGEHLAAATAQEMASLGIRQIRTGEELIAVQARQADVIARANDKAFNLAKDSEDTLSLARKTGLERTLAEINIKSRDYRDQLVDMSGGKDLEGIGAAFLPAKTAATGFATALDEATKRLAAFPGAAGGGVPAWAGVGPGAMKPGTAVPLSAGFQSSVERTLGFEGGLLPRDTNGTVTNFGINSASHPGVDVTHLTRDQAKGIYQTEYWQPLGLDQQSPAMQRVAFDTGVMEGVDRARRMMTQSGGDAGKMLDLRQTYEAGLQRSDPAKYGPFARSWALRDASLRADISGPEAAAMAPADGAMKPLTIHGSETSSLATAAAAAANARLPSASVLGVKLDTSGNVDKWTQNNLSAATIAATDVPIDRANLSLQNQIAMLETQRDMFGQSAAAIRGATEAQTLWNSLVSNNAAPVGELSKQIGGLADQVRLYGSAAERVAQQQEDQARNQKMVMDIEDMARGGLSSSLSSGLVAAAHGKSFGTAFKSGLSALGDRAIDFGTRTLFNGLLGQPGQGIGTGSIASLFGGGLAGGFGSYGPQLPGAGGGIGGFLSNIFGSFFGGSHATGGPIIGPGSGTSDSILARVSNGEYIMRAAAVQHYGGLMDRLNNLSLPKFADGGMVGSPAWAVPSGTADEAGVMVEGEF